MAELKEKVIGNEDRPAQPAETERLLKLEQKLLADAELVNMTYYNKARKAFQYAADARRRYDWEWLSRDLFRRGYQFSKYNTQTKTLTMATTSTTKIPINLTTASLRVIRNQVTAFRPKWEVLPNRLDDESHLNAKFSGKLLDYIFKRERLKKKLKETISQGLLFSVGGAWQIGWDPEAVTEDGSKGFVYIWLIDPFDFYIDPNATDGMAFTDAEFIIKAVRRPLGEVKSNPHYKNTQLLTKGDNKPAASEYKQFLLQALKMMNWGNTQAESETVILYEGWFKERDDKGKVKMRVITWVDSIPMALRNEVIDTSDFPFRMYQADINPLEVYGEGWARHVIPINRVINALESAMFDYNYKYNRGRILMDKNAGVRIVDNQHGSIIEKNRGADVRPFPLQPLSAASENQILRMRQYFEDISGAHDVSLGRIPVGVKSGIGIAELKQADATNQDDLVDNLEDFMVEVAKKILRLISEKVSFPRLIKQTQIGGNSDYFMIVGEKYAKDRKKKEVKVGDKNYPLAVIAADNTINVQIGSWLAYSKQQKQQELKDLYTSGVIDQKTLLEHLEFGDVESIIKRTQMEAILKRRREVQAATSTPVSEEELAMAENSMMLEGNQDVIAQAQDDHRVHMAVHDEYAKHKIVDLHMMEHQAFIDAIKEQKKQQALGPNAQAGAPAPEAQVPPEIVQAGMATAPTGTEAGAPQGAGAVPIPPEVVAQAVGVPTPAPTGTVPGEVPTEIPPEMRT